MVDNFAAFFNCMPMGRASDSMMAPTFSWLGPELLVCCLAHRGPTGVFLLLVLRRPGIVIVGQLTESVKSSFLFIRMFIMIYLFVLDVSLTT